MEIVTVCGMSYADFVIHRMAEVRRADLLVFSFGAVETIDFRKEIKGDDGVFADLCTLSYDLNCAVLCGAGTDVFGVKHKSVVVADKGRLVDVSDQITNYNVQITNKDNSASFAISHLPFPICKAYDTSAGKIGIIADNDIMRPKSAEELALQGAQLIVAVADKPVDNSVILAARAAGLYNGVPVLFAAKDYVMLSDGSGEVKFAGHSTLNAFSLGIAQTQTG